MARALSFRSDEHEAKRYPSTPQDSSRPNAAGRHGLGRAARLVAARAVGICAIGQQQRQGARRARRRDRDAELRQRRNRRRGTRDVGDPEAAVRHRPTRQGHDDALQRSAALAQRRVQELPGRAARPGLHGGPGRRAVQDRARGRCEAADRHRDGRRAHAARRRPGADAGVSPDARERQQLGRRAAPIDQPEQHHQREPR